MKLKLELANCYGINQLSKELDFTKSAISNGVNSLYAPNGTLKTSLAKTFKDVETGSPTKDLIFPERVTNRDIKIDNVDITSDQVLVIDSYNESYTSQQVSTLLVNDALKQQYEAALKEVDDKRNTLLKALAKVSGKRDIATLICEVFAKPEKSLLELFTDLWQQNLPDNTRLYEFKYAELFNPKVIDLICSGDFNQELAEYVDTYDKLIQESSVLSKVFNHQKAGVVSKSLTETGFFSASHSVNISVDGEKREVTSKEDLNQLLQDEQDKVLQSPELKEKFSRVDGKLKTKDTQAFRDFIAEHQELLPEYQNLAEFKQNVMLGYLQSQQAVWEDLVATYKQNQELVGNIVYQAQQQKTTWETVVETFNKRFKVPFKLSVDNQDEVILNGAAPAINFEFDDGRGESEQVSQSGLIAALSQGEKRALYILNVLFEIEIRRQGTQPILIVIDDIADSFDYKNKYAIVEYLHDIAKVPHFNLLLLTHNFDFHRIIGSRIIGSKSQEARNKRTIATKTVERIEVNTEKYQNDVFTAWKRNMHNNEAFMIASIPFVRNLTEYCGFNGDNSHYEKLTSLLHLKPNSLDLRVSDLQVIYRDIFKDKPDLTFRNADAIIIDKIFEQSESLVRAAHESPELECKVIVAMAIRLKAEQFMIAKIANQTFVNGINSNQTRELFDKYVEQFQTEVDTISLLDQVNLMTPENIHLNSFMYEPILDMSAHSLYQLYADIKQLLDTE
ncbi:ABC transporter ATP-binding protein [Ferrimonas futtsuensis]|uniref:ABC transporter ATP-binding protein n=1 Tax=Ferrimonas futtsuensis TaxID=364764 RepID=UPI000400B923|nr:ABC transporter ATP-binding protein [Ferrimonas futtsuensis]